MRNLLPRTKLQKIIYIVLLLLIVALPTVLYFAGRGLPPIQIGNKSITLFPHATPSPSPTAPPIRSTSTPSVSRGCGVTSNPDGTFTFSRLHVLNGRVVDQKNCVVHLLGVNMGALFLENANHSPPSTISWFTQHIPMNVVREAYNAYWWNTNVYVPGQGMHYQQWLQTVVKWQEQAGNYVILDNATQFHNPPCGDDGKGYHVSLCPSQNQAGKNVPLDPTERASYQPTALAALTDLAKLYGNDPAVIFDVWNEPAGQELGGISEATFFQSMNERINTVRQYAPHSIIMVYNHDQTDIEKGRVANYTQSNLIWDTHIYSPTWNPAGEASTNVSFAQNHNQGFIVGEWGGITNTPVPSDILPFINANAIGSTYFFSGDLVNGKPDKPTSLNRTGLEVAAGYAAIFAST